jgi:desulfoferrodoxin (superoxide reductase-like protein)
MDRRAFLGRSVMGAAAAVSLPKLLAGCGGDDFEMNPSWQSRAADLEGRGQIYTKAAPGKWMGKEGTHVPTLELSADKKTATVRLTHGMATDHYITTIYVKDDQGRVIGLRELMGSDSEALGMFTVPESSLELTAYAFCNLHDLWQSDSTEI